MNYYRDMTRLLRKFVETICFILKIVPGKMIDNFRFQGK